MVNITAIKEMKATNWITYCDIFTRLGKINRSDNTKCWWEWGKIWNSHKLLIEQNNLALWETVCDFLIK